MKNKAEAEWKEKETCQHYWAMYLYIIIYLIYLMIYFKHAIQNIQQMSHKEWEPQLPPPNSFTHFN